jgi:predicted MFS family arabinose efflux permease
METNQKTGLNKRSLNVLLMLFSFILLPPSGIIIHSTHGTRERELLRHLAMTVHNYSAIIFLTTCIIHLVVNRKILLKYISAKTNEYSNFKREAMFALLIVFGIVGFFTLHVFHAH